MTQHHDLEYLNVVQRIIENGIEKADRTGTGTYSIFDATMKFDLSSGSIPLLTTKKMHWTSIIHELLWYISGSTDNNDLTKNGVRIWSEWATESGELGPIYGEQLRNWNGSIDQLAYVIHTLKTDPDSRRMVVSYWNPDVLPNSAISPQENVELGKQALPPCHMLWQLYSVPHVDGKRRVSMKLTQRSADIFLGVPYNIVQYSILLHMICHITGNHVGDFIWSGGDVHLYSNHLKQAQTQLVRDARPSPLLKFSRDVASIEDFKFEDFQLIDYHPHPTIKAEVSV